MRNTDRDNFQCPYCGVECDDYEDKVDHIETWHLFRLKD